MIIRVRSRDGLERVNVDNPNATVAEFKSLIQTQLNVLISNQTLSRNQTLLLAKDNDIKKFNDMADLKIPLSVLNIAHGSIVYLAYEGERCIAGPKIKANPTGSLGQRMTMGELIARQMRIEVQKKPHCQSVSFDRDAANAFQQYVKAKLGFSVKRGGFMYGGVNEEGEVNVEFIYEPPQQGSEEKLVLLRDPEEEKRVEAIALGLGFRRLGFIFSQTLSEAESRKKKNYILSDLEIRQAAELHAESGLKEWVTALVSLKENEDENEEEEVYFEAFQLSDQCIRLFKDGWFAVAENCGDSNSDRHPREFTRMSKDVVVLGKDRRDVDNILFLAAVKILDHKGPLSSTFPIENRVPGSVSVLRALNNHLRACKNLPYVKRLSDFHLLLLLARYLDVNTEVPQLAGCVKAQASIEEGYQILIDSLASSSTD